MTKTWLVTGGSRGLGRALAEAVLAGGDNLVVTARRPEQLQDLVAGHGDHARAVALDVTDPAAAGAAVQAAVTAFGRLDVVVNNAGYADSASIEDMPEEVFRAQMETDFFGVVNVTRAALPVLRKQRSGHFIQVSSIGGRVGGTPGLSAYQSAKFAVEGFSEVLAAETGPLGIKVTIVEPGAFRTDWGGSSMAKLPVSEDYEQTVGQMNRFFVGTAGRWPGDPARAAQIITRIAGADKPPLRLLLGAAALESALNAGQARAAEAQEWATLTRAADYEDVAGQVEPSKAPVPSADPEPTSGSPGPFVFIATNRLKPGKLADEARRVPGLADFIQASEPRVIAFNEYASDDGTEVAVVQVHPDADSMAYHMGVVRERAQRAYAETLDSTTSIQVFGTPSEDILETLRHAAGTGVPITVRPSHLGGFTRRG